MDNQQQPTKTGLLALLRNSVGSQFVIPVYQRNYTWTAKKDVKQLFDDLKNVLNGKFNKHFMGILIYLNREIDYKSREFQIIDGQQRLTTTFLILYAVKELLEKQGKKDEAGALEEQYLTNNHVPDKMKLKLKPLVSDDIVYQQIVNNEFSEIRQKNSNVYKNYIYIKETLNELLNVYSINDILTALDKLYVVTVPVVKDDSPQKIFESINSTGQALSAADLIRNFILMDTDSDTQEKFYNDYWKKIEEYANVNSKTKNLELFFRMFLGCKLKILCNASSIYPTFKNWFVDNKNEGIENLLKEIIKYAKYYYFIYKQPINEVDTNLQKSISEFRKNISELPAPFLMEMFNLYESKLIDSNQFVSIIQLIDTYLIRRSICNLDTSDITRLFPPLLKDVITDCNGKYDKIVDYVKKHLINKQRGKSALMPDDDRLRTYLNDANVYVLRLWLKIIFDKIETHNNSIPVDLSKLSIEHLMPQTPTKEWLEALNVDEITYDKHLHRLGNLTLASKVDNSKMKNKPFEYKKEILKDTAHLVMNQKILAVDKWTIDEINKRNKELIEEIIKLYPYSTASNEVINKHEILLNEGNINATGFLFEEDGSVEIQAGSEIIKYNDETPDFVSELYDQLLEDGTIKETDNGAIFVKNHLFLSQMQNNTALSISASLILGANRNGWHYWKDANGKSLEKNTKLKNKLNNK